MKKVIIPLFVFLLSSSLLNAQSRLDVNSLFNGRFLIDYHVNAYSNLWYQLLILSDDNLDNDERLIKKILFDSLKNKLINQSEKYVVLESDTSDSYIFFNNKEKYNFYKIIKDKEDFFLLCSTNRTMCNCKAEMMIYIPKQNVFRAVERPFSFSILRNLKFRLENYGLSEYINNDADDLCEFITKL